MLNQKVHPIKNNGAKLQMSDELSLSKREMSRPPYDPPFVQCGSLFIPLEKDSGNCS
jgi:hypothetical protein